MRLGAAVSLIVATISFTAAASADEAGSNRVIAVQQALIQRLEARISALEGTVAQLKNNDVPAAAKAGSDAAAAAADAKKAGTEAAAAVDKKVTTLSSRVDGKQDNLCSGGVCTINGALVINYTRGNTSYSLHLPETWTNRPSLCNDTGGHCTALVDAP